MNNKLNTFENGGSHAENPNGGIPQGMGNNGLPNTVEEGETKMKIKGQDYIFSDRLRTSDDFIKQFNLPVYVNKKSFAKASEAIEERFKDRNDNASNSTKAVFMERLAEAQELARLQKEASDLGVTVDELLQIKQQEVMAAQQAEMMAQQQSQQGGQMMPEGAQQEMPPEEMPMEMQPTEEFTEEGLPLEPSMMAYGGYINEYQFGGFEDTNMVARKPVTAVTGTVAPMAPLQGSAVDPKLTPPAGAPGVDGGGISGGAVAGVLGGIGSLYSMTQNTSGEIKQDKAGSALSGAVTGASAGAALGPIGAGVGAVLGAGVGLFSAGKNNRAFQKGQIRKAQQASAEQTLTENGRAYGGLLGNENGDLAYGGTLEELETNDYDFGGGLPPHDHPHSADVKNRPDRQIQTYYGHPDLAAAYTNLTGGRPYSGGNKVVYPKYTPSVANKGFVKGSALHPNRTVNTFKQPSPEIIAQQREWVGMYGPEEKPQETSKTAQQRNNIKPTIKPTIRENVIDERPLATSVPFSYSGLTQEQASSIPIAKSGITPIQGSTIQADTNSYLTDQKGSTDSPDSEGGSNWAQYATLGMQAVPFLGNLYEGMSLDAPDPNSIARAGRTYIPNFADERAMLNVIDESYGGADRALAEASGGDLGAYRANLLGANIGKTKARSEAYRQVSDINRAEEAALNKDFADAIKEGVTATNLERDLDKQDRSAYDRAKRDYRIAAYEGLGKLGETIFKTNQMDDLSTYNIFGNKSLTAEQKKAAKEAARKAVEDNK